MDPTNPAQQNPLVNEQLGHLDTSGIQQFWSSIIDKYQGYLPESQTKSIFDMLTGTGNSSLSLENVLKGITNFFLHELLSNGKLLGAILIITVFAMILETMQSAFERKTVSTVGYAVVYLVLIVLALNSFRVAIDYATQAISEMVQFMVALVPLVLALMASTGNVTSVAIFHPMIVFLVNISGMLISSIVFPLLFMSVILNIVSTFSVKYQLTKLAGIFRYVGMGLLASFFTIFLAVLSLEGATSAVADGVAVKTVKYIAGNFIPVVGRMFSDATETVVGASLIVKNTIGLAGVLILVLIAAFPALKIFALSFLYNLSSAVMQPLGDSPVIKCLSIIGKNLLFVFAVVATMGLMFFLAITIIISASNLTVMVR